MRIGKLRKVFDTAEDLKTEVNRAYVIRSLGTNDNKFQNIYIDGKHVGNAHLDISPLRSTSSNRWGPLELGENYLVVPPLYVFASEGASGKLIGIDGEIYVLEPDETLPAELMGRFAEQSTKYQRLDTRSYEHGTNETWSQDQEVSVGTFKPPGNERWTFNSIIGVEPEEVGTVYDGDIGIVLKLDGVPLDQLAKGGGRLGIEVISIWWPPTDGRQEEPITLDENPVVVDPNHELEITAVNTSTSDITPGTDKTITINLATAYQKERVE